MQGGQRKTIKSDVKEAIVEAYVPNHLGIYPELTGLARRYEISRASVSMILKEKRRDLGLNQQGSGRKLTKAEIERFAKMVARHAKIDTLSKEFKISKNSAWARKSLLENIKAGEKFREKQKQLQKKKGLPFPGIKEGFISIRP